MKRIKPSRINCINRILFLVRVSGESCWPSLVPGKLYWATAFGRVRAGDFAVFRNPADQKQIFVKKILDVPNGAYEMGSTVSWGLSSKDFGAVEKKQVFGKIIFI